MPRAAFQAFVTAVAVVTTGVRTGGAGGAGAPPKNKGKGLHPPSAQPRVVGVSAIAHSIQHGTD